MAALASTSPLALLCRSCGPSSAAARPRTPFGFLSIRSASSSKPGKRGRFMAALATARKEGAAAKPLIRSKGRLGVSEAYLRDLEQLGLSDPAATSSSSSSSNNNNNKHRKPQLSDKGKERHVPAKKRMLAAEKLERRLFLKERKEAERDRRLKQLEENETARKRNRWAWEWFSEGRELEDIGEQISLLPKYAKEEPYPARMVTEWILTHLRQTPASKKLVDAIPADQSQAPVPPAHSLHLLTPESWARLSAPHPYWSKKSYEESLGAALENEDHVEQGVWDLLYARGWRGEGMGNVDADGAPLVPHNRHSIPVEPAVLAQFLKAEEIRAAANTLAPGRPMPVQRPPLPESARIALALERLKLKRARNLPEPLRKLVGSRSAQDPGSSRRTSSASANP